MFTKCYIIVLLIFCSFTTAMCLVVAESEEIKSISQPRQCYCSERCGPRDVTTEDSPFVDPETGRCFCQQWDKDNFELRGCHLQPTPEIENSYCK